MRVRRLVNFKFGITLVHSFKLCFKVLMLAPNIVESGGLSGQADWVWAE